MYLLGNKDLEAVKSLDLHHKQTVNLYLHNFIINRFQTYLEKAVS